ncbi:Hypothetical predicted protein [Mytilus galloprovincialis]|uniref:Uncharacterized protein n=1 Tax=Mytilus galloprovincialis TaxID=29158 RepID=A0A8B6CTJ7_MYTGA|nr:Hypothetical predicted protein [Mytilus galloprovincialis]
MLCWDSTSKHKQRALKMLEEKAQEYHKKSLKNVRAAINRHLKDIFRDAEFKSANSMSSVKLKFSLRNGLPRPTKHHPTTSISTPELMTINTYLTRKKTLHHSASDYGTF